MCGKRNSEALAPNVGMEKARQSRGTPPMSHIAFLFGRVPPPAAPKPPPHSVAFPCNYSRHTCIPARATTVIAVAQLDFSVSRVPLMVTDVLIRVAASVCCVADRRCCLSSLRLPNGSTMMEDNRERKRFVRSGCTCIHIYVREYIYICIYMCVCAYVLLSLYLHQRALGCSRCLVVAAR